MEEEGIGSETGLARRKYKNIARAGGFGSDGPFNRIVSTGKFERNQFNSD